MPLTQAQKHARKVIKEAARRMIAEIDRREWTTGCVQFNANFHLFNVHADLYSSSIAPTDTGSVT